MEFKFNANADIAKAKEGKGVDTGIHKAKITKAVVTKTKKGNNIMDVYFETNGSQFAVYGICIDEKWLSGAENFDYPTFMELAMTAGMKTGEMYDTEIEVTRDGKKVKEKAKAFKELENKVVNVAVYWEVDVYENKEKKSRKIQRVFNADGLSLAEVEAGKTDGRAMSKLEDRLADYETKAYKAWKGNGGGDDSDNDAPSTSASVQDDDDLI